MKLLPVHPVHEPMEFHLLLRKKETSEKGGKIVKKLYLLEFMGHLASNQGVAKIEWVESLSLRRIDFIGLKGLQRYGYPKRLHIL